MQITSLMLSYQSSTGDTLIRTINKDGEIYFSLFDVVKVLAAENRFLDPSRPYKSLLGLIKAHITHLLPEEILTNSEITISDDDVNKETYVTKAGLLRVVLQDTSPACIKFQKWVLNEVLPSIIETGSYSFPEKTNSRTVVPTNYDFDVEQMLRLQLQETIERKKADAALKNEVSQLTYEIESIKNNLASLEYKCITSHPEIILLPYDEQYTIFCHCLKLCDTQPDVYKSERNHGDSEFDKIFMPNVIHTAFKAWQLTQQTNRLPNK